MDNLRHPSENCLLLFLYYTDIITIIIAPLNWHKYCNFAEKRPIPRRFTTKSWVSMNEQLNFSIKEFSDEYENFSIEINNLLKCQKLSLPEIKAQIRIIKGLVETAMQLDDVRKDDDELTLGIFIEQKSVTVEVSTPVSESSYSRLGEMDKIIQRIRGCQSPFDPYVTVLKEISSRSKSNQSIEQVLAKLAYETGAVFDFYVTEDNILNLSAIRYLHRECVL